MSFLLVLFGFISFFYGGYALDCIDDIKDLFHTEKKDRKISFWNDIFKKIGLILLEIVFIGLTITFLVLKIDSTPSYKPSTTYSDQQLEEAHQLYEFVQEYKANN